MQPDSHPSASDAKAQFEQEALALKPHSDGKPLIEPAVRRAFVEEHLNFRVQVPTGQIGIHAIQQQPMTAREALIANVMGYVLESGRFGYPGIYTQLVRFNMVGYVIVMSDHQCEVADHEPLVSYCRDHAPVDKVLINGLGIGVALDLLAPYVNHFTIIELSKDVIQLSAPYYQNKYPGRIEVIQANALDYKPARGEHYGAVFHDIWDTISHENLPDMKLLHRRYGKHTDWQESWARQWCEREARKRKAHPEQYKNEVSMSELMGAINTLF